MRIGLVINPYAGLGGPAGLKGSDELPLPLKLSSDSRAEPRARRALAPLSSLDVKVFTAPGIMGEITCRELGLDYQVVGALASEISTAEDTERLVADMLPLRLDLLLFVGGDGTARNVCKALAGCEQVSLGIPAGVKMHSAVYAINPESATLVIEQMANAELVDVRLQEVRDIDEAMFQQGRVSSRYYGEIWVPEAGQFVQSVKNSGREVEALVLADMAAFLLEDLDDEFYYFIGPGSTPKCLLDELGLEGSLLGFDVLYQGELVAVDVNAAALEAYCQNKPGRCRAIITAIAGQGHLLGRGNQQLSPEVLQLLGRDGLIVLATKTKITELCGRPLLVDSNDVKLDQELSGHIRVICGYRDTLYYPLSCGYE